MEPHGTRRRRYDDPLDLVWLTTASRVGLTVTRSDAVFASYDGRGTLTLCHDEHFDPDDSLAQLVFHELCHALVAGEAGLRAVDWGMHEGGVADLTAEHACHRLQAALADRYGLRPLFGVTTDHRPYWDALPVDPLAPGPDPAIPLARRAFDRALEGPWAEPLHQALEATRALADAVRAFAPETSLWQATQPLHRAGFPIDRTRNATCASCAWAYHSTQDDRLRCRQTRLPNRAGRRVYRDDPACTRFEPRFDGSVCGGCGACCREAFDLVTLGRREPFAHRHPELIAENIVGLHVPRPGGRCVVLDGDGAESPYRCQDYRHRPRSCVDFEVRGDGCLEARRRLGLSV